MHRYGALATDLLGVALTPFIALLIRDNFTFYAPHWQAILGYATISFVMMSMALIIGSSHRVLWQYTSLPDVLKIVSIITVALVLAVSISFFESRLEGVARSVPVIQWFLLVSAIVGLRIAFRLWHERARRERQVAPNAPTHQILIVGVSRLTELYLETAVEYGSDTVAIAGILSDRTELGGRLLRQQKILGTVEELPQIVDRLEVHGVTIERVVVTESFERLHARAAQVLLDFERSSDVRVDWIVERLGLRPRRPREDAPLDSPLKDSRTAFASPAIREENPFSLGTYGYVKRAFDILLAVSISGLLAPLLLITALLVRADVGVPIVFWQQRPGRQGRPFKLFKFCTMRAAHDSLGNRIPDEQRETMVGNLLRRTRLDELPQLYNILVGEMSFVGPRPLLAIDQPMELSARLSVRPGLTGFAQVHGGRAISAEDKNALDLWYIRNASPWLDIEILLRTVGIVIRGERINLEILRAAREEQGRVQSQDIIDSAGPSLDSVGACEGRDAEAVRPAA